MGWVSDVTLAISAQREQLLKDLSPLKVDELRETCRCKGVKTSRKKQDMIHALVAHMCLRPSCFLNKMCSEKLHSRAQCATLRFEKQRKRGAAHLEQDIETYQKKDAKAHISLL